MQHQMVIKSCIVWMGTLLLPLHAEEETKKAPAQPIHFIRDIMQPMGTPLISSFHALKESQFLNMKHKGAKGLEAIGNLFLAPSRYLFAGKTIRVIGDSEEGYQLEQSFHYHKLHWFKTMLSLAVLPVTEAIGITVKGISYLWPKVRRKHRKVAAALKSNRIKSHLDYYHNIGLASFHSDEYIPCLHYQRPSQLQKRQKAEIKAFKEIVQLLDEHDILYWIDFGTCLGAYRYGGIIPWDWDIDLSILLPDHDNVKRVLSQLDPKKYQVQDWSSYSNPGTFLKIYVKKTKNFIDIMHYQIHEEDKKLSYFFTYENSPFPHSWKKDELHGMQPISFDKVFPLKKANFDGVMVWAPNDVETYLKSKYDNNLEPSNIWDEEAGCYRKVEDHPYWSN